MKTALITTTVNVPHVLHLYLSRDPSLGIFVAGDEKTPQLEGDFSYYSPEEQRALGYSCSELIGWNCIQRRNIALLEALKWGAELILTVDDDNIPLSPSYSFSPSFSGVRVSSPWFDVGSLLIPPVRQRGIPHTAPYTVSSVVNAKIGVAQGVCLGDPDISAVERLACAPTVHTASELLRSGVAFLPEPSCWTMFNTQSTAFLRELAPAMFCPPGVGRFDDILASLITQRVMRERGLSVFFGQPFFWQQRNAHNLYRDLREEQWGYENVRQIASILDATSLPRGDSVIEQCRFLWHCLWPAAPARAAAAALSFLDDCEKVL